MNPAAQKAHAVVMTQYGPPSVLSYVEVPLPPVGPHELRIRTLAAAVNHTDLEIRAGNWPVRKPDAFPYTPGVEVVGEVQEVGNAVQDIRRGDRVITMMQGLGGVRGERRGGYAEYVTVGAETVAVIPTEIDPVRMAALGLVGVTAYEGLRRIGQLADQCILVTGAAGGVGSAAVAIAHAQGASVVGLVARASQAEYVLGLGANEVIVAPRGDPPQLAPESVNGVLDCVGGDLFRPCVAALRPGGVLSLVGAVGGGEVTFDAWQLIQPVTLTGYSTETLDGSTLRQAVAALSTWLGTEVIQPPDFQSVPLAEARHAHERLEQGGVHGRILLVPAQSSIGQLRAVL